MPARTTSSASCAAHRWAGPGRAKRGWLEGGRAGRQSNRCAGRQVGRQASWLAGGQWACHRHAMKRRGCLRLYHSPAGTQVTFQVQDTAARSSCQSPPPPPLPAGLSTAPRRPADHGAERERRAVGLAGLLPLHAGSRHLLPQGGCAAGGGGGPGGVKGRMWGGEREGGRGWSAGKGSMQAAAGIMLFRVCAGCRWLRREGSEARGQAGFP